MSNERKVLVLNHQYLVDCTHVTFCKEEDYCIDYSSLLKKDLFRYTYFIKKEHIDCIGLELSLLRVIDDFCLTFNVQKADIVVNSPILIGELTTTTQGIVGKVVNNHMVETSISKWKEINSALDSYGPHISDNHLNSLVTLDQLPYYYIESVCFQEFRKRDERPPWFNEFIEKLKNERL